MTEQDDYYDDYSEFEQQINEFKNALMSAVKAEHKSEMERLRSENAELQKIKHNWESIETEYRVKNNQIEMLKRNYKRELRSARLSEIMSDYKIAMWRAEAHYEPQPKCDRCNDKREIPYTLPSGKAATEKCACSQSLVIYKPESYEIVEFRYNRGDNKISAHYIKSDKNDDEVYKESTYGKTAYKQGMEYTSINKYDTFFENEADCQKYCDWLNTTKRITP